LIALCGASWPAMTGEEAAKPAPAKKAKKAAGGEKAKGAKAKGDKAKKEGGGDAAATPAAAKRAQKAAEAKAAKQQGALCVLCLEYAVFWTGGWAKVSLECGSAAGHPGLPACPLARPHRHSGLPPAPSVRSRLIALPCRCRGGAGAAGGV
jgi:hypothetical protein